VLESECFGGVGSLQIIGCCACERAMFNTQKWCCC
jgi:hypothetical protein